MATRSRRNQPDTEPDEEVSGEERADSRARIPAGGLVLLLALTFVFGYGIYLKATGRFSQQPPGGAPAIASRHPSATSLVSTSERGAAAAPKAVGATPTAPGSSAAAGEAPLLPDRPGPPAVAPPAGAESPLLRAAKADGAPTPQNVEGGRAAPGIATDRSSAGGSGEGTAGNTSGASAPPTELTESLRKPEPAVPEGSLTRGATAAARKLDRPSGTGSGASVGAGPTPPPQTGADARALPPMASAAPAPQTPSQPAPGAAPSSAASRALGLYKSKKYTAAARTWADWVKAAPSGAWTVQIAAVHLDRAQAARSLEAIAGRQGLFVLPAAAQTRNLSPVCIGVYPSADEAKKAAGTVLPFPGSTSRPFARPLSALAGPS
jgi:hypothetical protein